ncbi:PREDICTED: nodal homolog [Ceratosolen solmsi marchali]|uniref:Nodal homolog n=1 Tax=Ceratosolen solmsi marchali TaxID=326594 RepID=A0AAJ6YN52_9HYME|nr:PREDICTED: nodal homolog [Ceratosolen solmsi marchali]
MNSIIESDKEREKRNARATKGQPEEALEVITGNRPKKFRREKKPQAQADANRSQKMHEFVSRRKSLENTLTSLDIYQRAMLREKLNLHKQDIIRPEILHKSLKVKREAAGASSVTVAAPTDECSKPQLEPCAKHELYVNFRDIGLSTIIAPEGYAAYQCRGHCKSPLSQEQKPTNHATIQGIIHKMNLASSEDVQTPCCVPVNLSSISILYHDEERDGVVLKSYADMAVLIPRLGRRTGNGSTQEEKDDNDLLDSPESLSSGKSLTKKSAPVAPPRTRKTGWGEDLKSAKQKGLFSAVDQERFVIGSKNSKEDDIPVIPDLDDIIEDTSAIDISSTPAVGASRAAAAYKELNTDLLKNKLFSKYDDVDLSILTEKLYPEHLVQEPDEVWTWDSLFAQVASEINSESQSKVKEKQ